MRVTTIIAAAGTGRRLGSATPKQFLDLEGQTLLDRSIAAFDGHPEVTDLVIVLPAVLAADPDRLGLLATRRPLRVVGGGPERQVSVARGFDAVDPATDVVLVHDAARPFVSAEVISRTIQAAVRHGAAICGLEARDTVKRIARGPEGAIVVETLPRESIFLAQTPQAFRRDVLAAAVAAGRAGVEATDEAALAERAGYTVHVVAGASANVKITTDEDLVAARGRAGASPPPGRIGTGYDLHRLVEGRPLVIGGVTVPSPRGALGHSDADVVCHAITDAVLGAASLGDIGRHFPDSDPQWKDASSLELLRRAAQLAVERRFEIVNADVTVVLEAPKIRDHADAMRAAVAGALGIDAGRVNVKAKTNEGLDAIGRGEAIAAHAVALLRQKK
ncbi:MAG TPA: 2-C-methyl-D-erythritol 4-phosphate cytidylyltransferase [Vicinamibacterales bacterium]|nr:2-C-methyl-D-erythritol 4-phosphate cytidylyltransferase [Vicinamibacterales bacterium]